jgi:putative ABC transport system substrate-binding protein
MVDRRTIVRGIASGVLLTALGIRAQPTAKVWRIGVLREAPVTRPPAEFLDALRERGWVEGRNIEFERRFADHVDQLPALALELVKKNVDIILTNGTPATRAAKQATSTIPIVFILGADPVESRLVASLARPGGNVTGFVWGDYDDKVLEVLKEALPDAARVVYPVREPNSKILKAASMLGMRIQAIPVQRPQDLTALYAQLRKAHTDAVLIPNIPWMHTFLENIAVEMAKMHLPAVSMWRDFPRAGGLLSYGPIPVQLTPRAVSQIDAILRGAKPADIAVEQPTTFELIVNLKTAKALGLTIPRSLLVRANEVIE